CPGVARPSSEISAIRATSLTLRPMASSKSPFTPVAYLAFVGLAGGLVYSFVASAREGEMRRRCSPTCLLRPDYAGADRKLPSFSLKDMNSATVSSDAY